MGSKVIYKVLVFFIFVCGLSACDRDPYHGFGCIAPESHPAVEWARSLSPEQLEAVYIETQKLSRIHAPENYETQFLKSEIPESLIFLNAEVIRVYRSRGPYIILANCFDERIELSVSKEGEVESTIRLHWAEPTNENPYTRGSQVLWQKKEGSISGFSNK